MSSSIQAPARKNKGRQRIKMEKIENESNLQVTFSKRRAGLFKNVNELCILCGVEVLIVVFSPSRKAYSYGHPDVESVMNKFLNGDTHNSDSAEVSFNQMIMKATRNSKIRFRNLELTQLNNRLALEKKKSKELKALKKQGQTKGRIAPPFEKFNLEQLKFFEKTITNYEKHFDEDVAKFMSHNRNLVTNLNDTYGLYATGGMQVANNVGSGAFVPSNNPSFPHVLDNVAAGFDFGPYKKGGINDTGEVPFQSEWINNWATCFRETGVYSTDKTKVANTVSSLYECNSWAPSFGDTRVYATGGTSAASNFVSHDPFNPARLVPNDHFTPSYNLNAADGVADPYGMITNNPSDQWFT